MNQSPPQVPQGNNQMATFDSTLEALAFEYASFGVFAAVNNVWTWIAVVTAAVSFWRIRITSSSGDDNGCVLLEEFIGSKSEQESCNLEPESMSAPVEETVTRVKETVAWEPLLCDDGVTKGKLLTMYYYDVGFAGEKCFDGELTAVNEGEGLDHCGEWWERWERVVKMRNGDDGWYRHVDLTVINGSVVRLWDDNNGICDRVRC